MREAVAAGAALINDVSALTFSPDSLATVAELKRPVLIVHAKGTPETMQDNPVYKDAVIEVFDFLEARIAAALDAGLPLGLIAADPGIGFGKTLAPIWPCSYSMPIFHGLGVPLMAGMSRKGSCRRSAAPKRREKPCRKRWRRTRRRCPRRSDPSRA